MGEMIRTRENSNGFHIHVDGALLPKALESYAKSRYGFFNDDFDHRLLIDGHESLPARQLTLKTRDRSVIRGICEDLSERASGEGFAGLIQSEFVMAEMLLRSEYSRYRPVMFPFFVKLRRLDSAAGERFKSHELHLELPTDETDARLVSELARSGMVVAFGSREVTFTVSGDHDAIRRIQDELLGYLREARGFERAKLITEATVFHSLHRMRPEDTPPVVHRIIPAREPLALPEAAASFAPSPA